MKLYKPFPIYSSFILVRIVLEYCARATVGTHPMLESGHTLIHRQSQVRVNTQSISLYVGGRKRLDSPEETCREEIHRSFIAERTIYRVISKPRTMHTSASGELATNEVTVAGSMRQQIVRFH